MRQLGYIMFISNNRASFHLWWNKNLLKHQKVSKYYESGCRLSNLASVNTVPPKTGNYVDLTFLQRPCFTKYIKQVSFSLTINITTLTSHDYGPKKLFHFSSRTFQYSITRKNKTFMEDYIKNYITYLTLQCITMLQWHVPITAWNTSYNTVPRTIR